MTTLRQGCAGAVRTFRYALDDTIETKLPQVTTPTLVVRGSRDPIVPERWARDVARLLPSSSYSEIGGAPHCVNYSSAGAFVQLLRRFAATL